MIENQVKLVIWDLDETFWRGTLAEEGITPIPRNAEIVRELSRRGIVNSISSKNDFERAKAKLVELDIWEHFVFPSIAFQPKGQAIAALIEGAALRPDNVLFIDDNPSNLEEAKFFSPGIMTAHPDDLLDGLLDHPQLKGKSDPELKRLKQYQVLQRKADEKSTTTLSNEEFLRQCGIHLTIDHDVEKHFDRVVELINRTNQLNYTKTRLETPEAIEEFRTLLGSFSYYAGCVHAVDNYGDYGLIGFFLMRRTAGIKSLIHFVFSCRTMNMGVEQYIYEMLGSPNIEIAQPVSYGLKSHEKVDWIALDNQVRQSAKNGKDPRLVLIGGCDLLQVASYCSTDRLEFVNRMQGEVKVRFDDPGFIMSDREAIRRSETIRALPCWGYDDAIQFDQWIASSQIILLSMWAAMSGDYFIVDETVSMRLTGKQHRRLSKIDRKAVRKNFEIQEYDDEQRTKLVMDAFDAVAKRSAADSRIFVLGTYSQGEVNHAQVERRRAFNEACREYCAARPDRFRYIDVDALVPPSDLVDKVHFSRAGYFAIARSILEGTAPPADAVAAAS